MTPPVTTPMTTRRGFALPIVFLVLLLLGIAFFGLSDTLVVSAKGAARRAEVQQKFYACEGVVRMAQGLTAELSLDDPNLDVLDLSIALEPVRATALLHGIDLSAPVRLPEETVLIEEGALEGLEVIASAASFGVASDPSIGCNFNVSQPLGKISPLQFVAFSVAGGEIESGTNVFTAIDPEFSWGRVRITAPSSVNDVVTATDQIDAPLRLPAPAEGGEAVGGARARTFRPYLQPPFTNNPTSAPERASSRFAYQADIRIVDGEWYVRDPANPTAWPGLPVWGDHPCDDHDAPAKTCAATYRNATSAGGYDAAVPQRRRLYSAYERNRDGIVAPGGQPPRGIVSYGKLAGSSEPGVTANGACPGSGIVAVSTCGDKKAGAALGAREAWADPVSGAPVLPINIDVALLGQALATLVFDELGSVVCNPLVVGCTRPFNGMVYVTSTKGAPPALAPGAFPFALCGGSDASIDAGTGGGSAPAQPCASAVRYNAVRLHNAVDLRAFAATGLTIATDLPVYVQGDFNRTGLGAGALVRALIMGDRVTTLTSSWRDDGTGAGGGTIDLHASVIAGWPPTGPKKLSELLRVVESGTTTRVVGSLVGGFTSTIGPGRGGRIGSWTHPFDLTRPTADAQPPGVPRVALGLPADIEPAFGAATGSCGGG